MSFVPGTNYYVQAVGEDELGGLGPGDVLVLEPGVHVVVNAIGDGVTIRGRPGQRDNTIIQCADIAVGAWATVRGVTIENVGGDAALSVGGGSGMRWIEDCRFVTGTTAIFEASESWTFARCLFDGGNTVFAYGADALHVFGCLFAGTQIYVTCIESTDFRVYNNTFAYTAAPGAQLIEYGADVNKLYNNVFAVTGADTPLILEYGGGAGTTTIYGNWSTYDLGNPAWGTVVADLRLRSNGYPTNESPLRIAATPQVDDAPLDARYLPFATARSAGCYQWVEDATALYRRRYVDPLDGFVLDFDSATLDEAPGRVTFDSHLELAAYVRAFVNDLMHPSFGTFHTTATGAYRLRSYDGDPFDLTISGESATVFGAAALSAVDDTD